MKNDKTMDEVIENLGKLPPEEETKKKEIFGKMDRLTDLAGKLGLDVLIMARDAEKHSMASGYRRVSDQPGEDEFSVANGLLTWLIMGMIEDDPQFLMTVLMALKNLPNVELKIGKDNVE